MKESKCKKATILKLSKKELAKESKKILKRDGWAFRTKTWKALMKAIS